jgi:hypothetical protein
MAGVTYRFGNLSIAGVSMKVLLVFLALLASPVFAQEKPPGDVGAIESELKAKPDDPLLHAKKCQALFNEGKEQEAVDHAKIAMSKFISAKNKQASIKLGELKSKSHRIEVHFNMGPKERSSKPDGIVRPLSFKLMTDGEKPSVSKVLDFELGYINGEALTAAVGETTKQGHGNYGILDPGSDFATIKKKVLEVVDSLK